MNARRFFAIFLLQNFATFLFVCGDQSNPLFEHFPQLREKIPYISLGKFPTPIHRLKIVEKKYGIGQLYLKDDGVCAKRFGGNKIRKLEFLLADAKARGAKTVIALGAAGSNYATAVAAYAPVAGLKSIMLLTPQIISSYVRRNLLLMHYYNADIQYFKTDVDRSKALKQYQKSFRNYYTPVGGSNEIGTLGFINAAFELKAQIDEGVLPEPDYIYMACASAGSCAGLIVGLQLAGVHSQVVCVRVIPAANTVLDQQVLLLARSTNEWLHQLDDTLPIMPITGDSFQVRNDSFGKGYGKVHQREYNAIKLLREKEGFVLDGTYAGKSFDALIDDARAKKLQDSVVLYWKTNASGAYARGTSSAAYTDLPIALQDYFTHDVQPLDQGC